MSSFYYNYFDCTAFVEKLKEKSYNPSSMDLFLVIGFAVSEEKRVWWQR
jgi:hypothetical protein